MLYLPRVEEGYTMAIVPPQPRQPYRQPPRQTARPTIRRRLKLLEADDVVRDCCYTLHRVKRMNPKYSSVQHIRNVEVAALTRLVNHLLALPPPPPPDED